MFVAVVTLLACSSSREGTGFSRKSLEDPDSVQLYYEGIMHLNDGHLKEAQAVFRQVVLKDPDYAAAWNNLGKAYLLDKKFLEAEAAFQRATILLPSFEDAHNNLGVLYMEMDRLEDAEKEFTLARQGTHLRQSPILWENMGILAKKQGDIEKAVRYFTESIRKNEKYHPARILRGECYEELGRPELASEDYEKALEELGDEPKLMFLKGRVLVKMGKYEKAREYLERVTILVPGDAWAKKAQEILNTLP